uniref:Uncharacterized protein n=1 Tax=Loa loa TaxID=7209 RepID=A0A1I7W2H7_LOALO
MHLKLPLKPFGPVLSRSMIDIRLDIAENTESLLTCQLLQIRSIGELHRIF